MNTIKAIFALLYLAFSIWGIYITIKIAQHVNAWPF